MKRRRARARWRSRKSKNVEEPSAAEAIFNSSASQMPWVELPKDVTANILQRLGIEEILESAQKVCTTWREACRDPSMWRVIDLKCEEEEEQEEVEYGRMCRCAVDLSQRQLIDLRFTCFGDDKLLRFVADRSSHLQRLTLAHCPEISGNALVEAVKKFPQLQELHLIRVPWVLANDIEAIGISCPMLKSFTFNEHQSQHPMYSDDDEPTESKHCNEYSLVIAKNMPNLRHLKLFAHWMRNDGLEAILDGCPHLESLDIRECKGLDLQGALGERCCKQIKDLRGPSDSTSDFEWPGGEPPSDEWDDDPYYYDHHSGLTESFMGSSDDPCSDSDESYELGSSR